MALSYNLPYQEIISVHRTRRQNFAGKTDSTFWNIWQWVIYDCLIRCYYSSLDDLVNHNSQWECEGEWVSDTSTLRYSSSMHPILSSPRLRSWESLECGARLWKWVDGLKFDAVGQLFKVFPVNRAPLCNLTQTTHHFQHHSLQLVFNENLAKWLFSNNQLGLRLVWQDDWRVFARAVKRVEWAVSLDLQ